MLIPVYLIKYVMLFWQKWLKHDNQYLRICPVLSLSAAALSVLCMFDVILSAGQWSMDPCTPTNWHLVCANHQLVLVNKEWQKLLAGSFSHMVFYDTYRMESMRKWRS